MQAKRMFGGYGLFVDKLMFGLVADSALYLKVDESSRIEFVEMNLQPFTYIKNNKPTQMSYFQAPEEIYEDSEQASIWFNRAYAAALRSKK